MFVLSGLVLSACDSRGITRSPPTNIRIINAAPTFPPISFLRENDVRGVVPLAFGSAAAVTYDSDTYDFNLEVTPPGGQAVTAYTTSQSVNDQNEYVFVITEINSALNMLVIAEPRFDRAATTSQLIVAHSAQQQARFDAYFQAIGTAPAAGNSIGNVGFSEHVITGALTPGDFYLVLTEPGNPANILFESQTVPVGPGSSIVIAITDEGNRGTAPFSVILVGNIGQQLQNVNQSGAIRYINAATDMAARDVYLDGDFTTPLFPAASFGTISPYVPIAVAAHVLDSTLLGSLTVEASTNFSAPPSLRHTSILTMDSAGIPLATTYAEDHRGIEGESGLRLTNGASQFDNLEVFIIPPGTDISTAFPLGTLGSNGQTVLITVLPGNYDFVLRDLSTSTIVAGPTAITLANRGVHGLLFLDAIGGSTVDVVIYDDTL
jgi:hypothetical protein